MCEIKENEYIWRRVVSNPVWNQKLKIMSHSFIVHSLCQLLNPQNSDDYVNVFDCCDPQKVFSSCYSGHLAGLIQNILGEDAAQERIAFLCPNDVSYVIAQWATWMAGHIGASFKLSEVMGLSQDSRAQNF